MRKTLSCGLIMLLFSITTSMVFAFPYPNAEIKKGKLTVGTGVVFNFMGFKGTDALDNYIEYGINEKIGVLISYDDAHPFDYDDTALAGEIIYQYLEEDELIKRGKKYSASSLRLGFIRAKPTDVDAWALSILRNYDYTNKFKGNFGLGLGYPTKGDVPHQLLALIDAGLRYKVIKNIYFEASTILIFGLETKDRRGEGLPTSIRIKFEF
ncbi:MAG: hypothetical protein QME42_02200 [bacterium]|nr:hypothetical protein [bacterium]